MAKNGYDQTYEDDRKENEETRNLILNPLRKAKDYVVDKVKGMDQRSLEQVAKDTLGKMDQRSLQDVYEENVDQRSLEDVFKGKPPKYKQPVKKAKGGSIKASSASKRADGCCVKGKTRGRMV